MATNKSEESHLTSTDDKEAVNENTYDFMSAVKATILFRTFPFNHVNTGFMKIFFYWLWIILVTIGLNLPLTYLFHDYDRIKRIVELLGFIPTNTLFISLLSALLLGKTRKNIKRPAYVQILTLIFISLTYLPVLTLFYFFVRKKSTFAQSNYACVSALIPFVFIVRNLNTVWKFTHHKFFFVIFYIILYLVIVGNLNIFFIMMHGSNSDIDKLLKPPSF